MGCCVIVIYVKDKVLKRRVFARMKIYDDRAISAFKRGDMEKGKAYEKMSDKLYAKNYRKMFGVR